MRTKEEELAFKEASHGIKEFETILKIFHDGRSKSPKKLTKGLSYDELAKNFGVA